jgi:hypothetical protein
MAITQEQLDALEAQYKRIAHVKGRTERDGAPEWEVVFRAPKRSEYKMYKKNSFNEAAKADAQEILARQTVVFPSVADFDLLLDIFPGIPEAASRAFTRLAGMESNEAEK